MTFLSLHALLESSNFAIILRYDASSPEQENRFNKRHSYGRQELKHAEINIRLIDEPCEAQHRLKTSGRSQNVARNILVCCKFHYSFNLRPQFNLLLNN